MERHLTDEERALFVEAMKRSLERIERGEPLIINKTLARGNTEYVSAQTDAILRGN